MADVIKTVGDGHTTPDYATLTLWNAGEGAVDPGVGFTSIANCSGYCGAGADINGAFVRGATIQGDVVFDASNLTGLAEAERLIITSLLITVTDLRIFTDNQFVSALNYNAVDTVMSGVLFDNTTVGLNALDINVVGTTGSITKFIARGGVDAIMAGFNQGTALSQGLVYGAVDKGIEAGGSSAMTLDRLFAFNNGGEDIDSAGGFGSMTNCATEDTTGTAGLTGYTSAELVNFAGGDFRTKATSDLASVAGGFVGVELEISAGGFQVAWAIHANQIIQ